MEVIPNARGGSLIGFDGYLYRKDREAKHHISWRCARPGCKARLTSPLSPAGLEPSSLHGDHCHAPDPAKVEVKKLQARVREKAAGISDPPRRIIADEVGDLSQEAAAQVRTNRNLAALVTRKRKREHRAPPAPKARTGFEIPDSYASLKNGTPFLLSDTGSDDDKRILIFASQSMMDLLSRYFIVRSWNFN